MSPDELRELGEDIKKNGMRSPITLWAEDKQSDAVLLDGRNRLDAIEAVFGRVLVGTDGKLTLSINTADEYWAIERTYRDGWGVVAVDPYEYVISANIRRR